MEKNRASRIIAVVTLCVALLGVSVGFAAWSTTLVISGAKTNVSQGDEAASFTNLLTFGTPTCTPSGEGATATSVGSLDSAKHTWSGATVSLSKPGDYVTCTSTVSNASAFIAYIKGIDIANAITCSNTTSGQAVTGACNSLKLTVTANAGSKTSTATAQGSTVTDATGITGSGIPAKTGSTPGTGTISFKIEYVSGGTISDADFTATLPTMTFSISTLDS